MLNCKLVYAGGDFSFVTPTSSNHKGALKIAKDHMIEEFVLNAKLLINGKEHYAINHEFKNNETKATGILEDCISLTVKLDENFFASG
ncbi:hypothetical protein [Paenibacillus lutimineralis]|uniref:Uncharacterized protein n=1 Tax=Paenibacillus lutimineralis TaxID=2707005 RepID=A0A3Q9IA61_9BACL|nr:hypothetical protein [Paenibacillus lutimineralis]AZS14574.1 hypothetical protein EI981_08995 [Paenibacillus lutimineralis]